MERVREQLLGWSHLHDLSEIHDGDLVGKMIDDGQVVGDEDIGQAHLPLQLAQQVQNLRLNGNIQRGNRLIADDKLRIHGQRSGNADTLPSPAVQLVGIGVEKPWGKPNGAPSAVHNARLFHPCHG